MATYVPKQAEPLLNFVPSPGLENAVSIASKLARGKILLDREIRGFEKIDRDGPRGAYEHSGKGGEEKRHRKKIEENRKAREGQPKTQTINNTRNYISLVDLDYKPNLHQNTRFYSKIDLPFVPRELSFNPESNFVGIASFGRNNPFYQFTGAEDTLTFEIDWFSEQNNREDVIFNCRWVEALTKADGYNESPHRVKIVWGNENKLFDEDIWLVVAAPYKLSQFVRAYREGGNIVDVGMLPQQANQLITLKKLTSNNLTSADIIKANGKSF